MDKETTDWIIRALGAFIACQHYGVEPPKFYGGYTGFVIETLGGYDKEIKQACEKFVSEVVPLIQAAEKNEKPF